MGLDCTIRYAAGRVPEWDAIRQALARTGEPAPLRMIDGLPAFPDETPDPGWRELRVGTGAGMITLRRGPDALSVIVWGNADAALLAARDRLLWACAAAGTGLIETDRGPVSADEFAREKGISPV
jgi:hypothetical protein